MIYLKVIYLLLDYDVIQKENFFLQRPGQLTADCKMTEENLKPLNFKIERFKTNIGTRKKKPHQSFQN